MPTPVLAEFKPTLQKAKTPALNPQPNFRGAPERNVAVIDELQPGKNLAVVLGLKSPDAIAEFLGKYPEYFTIKDVTGLRSPKLSDGSSVSEICFRRKAAGAHVTAISMLDGAVIAGLAKDDGALIPAILRLGKRTLESVQLFGPPTLMVQEPTLGIDFGSRSPLDPDVNRPGLLVPGQIAATLVLRAKVFGIEDFNSGLRKLLGDRIEILKRYGGGEFPTETLHATVAVAMVRDIGIPFATKAECKAFDYGAVDSSIVKPVAVDKSPKLANGAVIATAHVIGALLKLHGGTVLGPKDVPTEVLAALIDVKMVEDVPSATTNLNAETRMYAGRGYVRITTAGMSYLGHTARRIDSLTKPFSP